MHSISIHALRVEGDGYINISNNSTDISIHALRVEGDMYAAYLYRRRREISIHALRVEGDFASCRSSCLGLDFYPRPPGGGRLIAVLVLIVTKGISIHALRVEGDPRYPKQKEARRISIHALRVEGDVRMKS